MVFSNSVSYLSTTLSLVYPHLPFKQFSPYSSFPLHVTCVLLSSSLNNFLPGSLQCSNSSFLDFMYSYSNTPIQRFHTILSELIRVLRAKTKYCIWILTHILCLSIENIDCLGLMVHNDNPITWEVNAGQY